MEPKQGYRCVFRALNGLVWTRFWGGYAGKLKGIFRCDDVTNFCSAVNAVEARPAEGGVLSDPARAPFDKNMFRPAVFGHIAECGRAKNGKRSEVMDYCGESRPHHKRATAAPGLIKIVDADRRYGPAGDRRNIVSRTRGTRRGAHCLLVVAIRIMRQMVAACPFGGETSQFPPPELE